MSWLTELSNEVGQRLASVEGARSLDLPKDMAVREGTLGDAAATMQSYAWSLPGVPWFRLACLDAGVRARVFSALALPDPARRTPMFGAEIVEIRGRITVIAIDWMPVGGDAMDDEELHALRRTFDDFPPGGDLPAWARAAFSPHALYSRPGTPVDESRLGRALQAYLQGYLDRAATAPDRADASAASRYIRHYCREHFDNDPGGRMLDGIFGKAWVERYAREFLFRNHG